MRKGGGGVRRYKNPIAFGKAPRREADSQPMSQSSGKQSVRQSVGQAGWQTGRHKHTETHSLGFFSVADCTYKQWGLLSLQEWAAVEWNSQSTTGLAGRRRPTWLLSFI